ncbi:DPP IV N-terminal domain-containing protein, partial [Paenibacillus sp.]
MNQRAIKPEDLVHYRWISQPVISPNGQVAYVEQTIDQDKNEYNTQIRGISLDGDEDIALSDGTKDSSPAWSPDGTQLTFIRSVDGGKGLWTLRSDKKEPVMLISPAHKIWSYIWSPNGQYIAFTSKVRMEDQQKKVDVQQESAPVLRGKVFERTTPKAEGSGWWDGQYSHLFVYEIESGEITQVTSGLWNISAPAWSPDSQSLSFISKQVEDEELDVDLLYFTDVYSIRLGEKDLFKVTDSSLAVSQFSYSSDGQQLLLIASDRKYGSGSHNRLYAIPVHRGIPRPIAPQLDMQMGNAALGDMKSAGASPSPLTDNKHPERGVYVLGTQNGNVDVYRIQDNGECQSVTGAGEKDVYQYSLTPDGTSLVIAALTDGHPGELYRVDID